MLPAITRSTLRANSAARASFNPKQRLNRSGCAPGTKSTTKSISLRCGSKASPVAEPNTSRLSTPNRRQSRRTSSRCDSMMLCMAASPANHAARVPIAGGVRRLHGPMARHGFALDQCVAGAHTRASSSQATGPRRPALMGPTDKAARGRTQCIRSGQADHRPLARRLHRLGDAGQLRAVVRVRQAPYRLLVNAQAARELQPGRSPPWPSTSWPVG